MLAVADFVREAQSMLRDGSHWQWATAFLLTVVFYVYSVEIEARRWEVILAGISLWLMDWLNEIGNALVLKATDRAPLWTTTGSTSYQILIGLNIELTLMFMVFGVLFVRALPADPRARVLGLPNRVVFVTGASAIAVAVEVFINRATDAFHWEYWWWGFPWGLPTILVFGYATFFAMAAWVFDMGADHRRQLRVVGALAAAALVAGVVFGPVLGWL